ncbi:MAG: amino acid ABC transporter permease [Verrucomicrobia bacterium]|nr:amino acid ABC transporter permease [Verrucomicrobiota bacterium]
MISALRSTLFAENHRPTPWLARFVSFTLTFGVLSLVCFGFLSTLSYHWAWSPVLSYSHLFWTGWLTTIGYIFGQALSRDFRFLAGALILSLFSGAYLSEIIRAGIEGIGKSQLETAQAIGLTRSQTYRYVIFPQAFRQILPPFAGEFASIIKNSSLLSVLGIEEFALAASSVSSFTLSYFESYLPVALGYLLLTLPISLWTQSLEKRARFDT